MKNFKTSSELFKKKFFSFWTISADTIFLTQNRLKYDVIVGMYHDQVLTPIKTLFEYDAINITLAYRLYEFLLIMAQMKTCMEKINQTLLV